jgi:hypothetical protein
LIRMLRNAAATFSSFIRSAHCKRLRNSSSAVILGSVFFFVRVSMIGAIATKAGVRILSKKCSFGGKRGDVSSRLRDGMKAEDWLADCQPIFNTTSSGMTHLLALYLEANIIELV